MSFKLVCYCNAGVLVLLPSNLKFEKSELAIKVLPCAMTGTEIVLE